jgi:hypothetical protein
VTLQSDPTPLTLNVWLGHDGRMKVPDLATFIYRLPNYFFPTSTGILFRSFAVIWRFLIVLGAVYITLASVWYEFSLWGEIN